jgi:hypothetical protein
MNRFGLDQWTCSALVQNVQPSLCFRDRVPLYKRFEKIRAQMGNFCNEIAKIILSDFDNADFKIRMTALDKYEGTWHGCS